MYYPVMHGLLRGQLISCISFFLFLLSSCGKPDPTSVNVGPQQFARLCRAALSQADSVRQFAPIILSQPSVGSRRDFQDAVSKLRVLADQLVDSEKFSGPSDRDEIAEQVRVIAANAERLASELANFKDVTVRIPSEFPAGAATSIQLYDEELAMHRNRIMRRLRDYDFLDHR